MWPWNAEKPMVVLDVNVYILYSTFIYTSEVLTRKTCKLLIIFYIDTLKKDSSSWPLAYCIM